MKLIIGNKNYSSWSLRGWLAAKQSGLHFDEITVPLYGEDWDQRKKQTEGIEPSSGKVPVLWDGDAVVWDSAVVAEYTVCTGGILTGNPLVDSGARPRGTDG